MDQKEKELFESIERENGAYEMALEKKIGLKHLKGISKPFTERLIKLVVYGRSLGDEVFEHWIEDDVCNYLSHVNDIEVKTPNKKLQEIEYRKGLLTELGETVTDYSVIIRSFRIKVRETKEYPDFQVKPEMATALYAICSDLFDEVCPILSTQNQMTQADFVPVVKEILAKNGIK